MKIQWLSLLFLSITSITQPMEQLIEHESIQTEQTLEKELFEGIALPNEIWAKILKKLYFDLKVLDKADTKTKSTCEGFEIIEANEPAKDISIHEAIQQIKTNFRNHNLTISLVCKTFKNLTIFRQQSGKFRKSITEFYIPYLNEKFLEKCEGDKGLYPKNGEWTYNTKIDKAIALFISTRNIDENLNLDRDFLLFETQLVYLLLFYGFDPDTKNKKGFTPLALIFKQEFKQPPQKTVLNLLGYGANPNIQDPDRNTPLLNLLNNEHFTSKFHGERSILKFMRYLLAWNAKPNIIGQKGFVALHCALKEHSKERNYRNIIILLLEHGANPNLENNRGQNAFDIALEINFTEFPQLVKKHAHNTLTKICILHILNNLPLYEDQLDALPKELQDKINSLRS